MEAEENIFDLQRELGWKPAVEGRLLSAEGGLGREWCGRFEKLIRRG
jgi:hypothetical protein